MADDPHDPGFLNAPAHPDPAEGIPTQQAEGAATPVPEAAEPEIAGPEAAKPEATALETAEPEAPSPRLPFLGEIVHRRSWPLIAIVFLFGLFLAAVPFLFQAERSPFADALSLYDRICASNGRPSATDLSAAALALDPGHLATALSALPCVPRSDYRPRMDPVQGRQYGADRAFVVTLERRVPSTSSGPDSLHFLVEEEGGAIRWSPWPATTPTP